jgi:hypothetical protein
MARTIKRHKSPSKIPQSFSDAGRSDPAPSDNAFRARRQMSLAAARTTNQRRMRLIRDARAVHRLGERATFEAFDEIARAAGCRAMVEAVVARFAELDPVLLCVVRGDRFPLGVLRRVGGEP